MVASVVQSAKRTLVSLLKRLANKHGVPLEITRGSDDSEVRKAYRKVSRKVHPDRGGSAEDQKKLTLLTMRGKARRLDLQDLQKGRPPLSKAAYVARVKAAAKTKEVQDAAKAKSNAFRDDCREVERKKGAASRS